MDRKITSYIALAIGFALIIVLFFFSKAKNQLEQEVKSKSEQLDQLEVLSAFTIAKSKADELLIKGEYDQALKAYQNVASKFDSLEFGKDRAALVERFKLINSKLDESISSSEWAKMNERWNKEINQLKEKHKEALEELKNKQQTNTKDLLETIARQEKQLKNKPELGRLTFYNAKGTKIAYFGEVKFGKANGEGVGHYSSNSMYDGQWKNNMKHGKGTYKWIDGHKYVGDYQNDKREGKGMYYWNTGEKYDGDWKNNKRNGTGTLYDKDGVVKLKGNWVDDEFVK